MFKIIATPLEDGFLLDYSDKSRAMALASVRSCFDCSITQDLFDVPVVMSDGNVYEFYAINMWLADHNTSPLTGEAFGDLSYTSSLDFVLLHQFYQNHPAHTKYPNFDALLDRVTNDTGSLPSACLKRVLDTLQDYWNLVPEGVLLPAPEPSDMLVATRGYKIERQLSKSGDETLVLSQKNVDVSFDEATLDANGFSSRELMGYPDQLTDLLEKNLPDFNDWPTENHYVLTYVSNNLTVTITTPKAKVVLTPDDFKGDGTKPATELMLEQIPDMLASSPGFYDNESKFAYITARDVESYDDAFNQAKEVLSAPGVFGEGDSLVYKYTKKGRKLGSEVTRYLVFRYEGKQTKGWRLGMYSLKPQNDNTTLGAALRKPKSRVEIDQQADHIESVSSTLLFKPASSPSMATSIRLDIDISHVKHLVAPVLDTLHSAEPGTFELTKLFSKASTPNHNIPYYIYRGAVISVVTDHHCVSQIYVKSDVMATVEPGTLQCSKFLLDRRRGREGIVRHPAKRTPSKLSSDAEARIKDIIKSELKTHPDQLLSGGFVEYKSD